MCLGPGKSRRSIDASDVSIVILRTSHKTGTLVTRRRMTGNVRKTQMSNHGVSLDNKTGDMKHAGWFCLRGSDI